MKIPKSCMSCVAQPICGAHVMWDTVICRHFHKRVVEKLPKSYAESEKLFLEWWHTGSRADTLSRKNIQMFYDIVVGNNGR